MDTEIFEEYFNAARQGDIRKQTFLGLMYAFGFGTAQNRALAVEHLNQAAEQGDELAQFILGMHYASPAGITAYDEKQAEYWFLRLAERGNPLAQYALGILFRDGYGVEKDEELADYWFDQAKKGMDDPATGDD